MIVGVHGIAQQLRGPERLQQEWLPALRDGMTFALGATVSEVDFRIAFYGNLFRHRLAQPGGKSADSAAAVDLSELSASEVEDLLDAVTEVVGAEELEVAAGSVDKGFPALPGPLAVALRALEARFGAAGAVLALGELRQVRRYLLDHELKARVDGIVTAAMSESAGGARVLIGHSLGSVVAFEFARQHPDHPLELLVTLGSPLSLRMVRSRLPDSSPEIPVGVKSWVNVRDPKDSVALGGDLTVFWPGVVDRHVDNGRRDPHSVAAYLSDVEIGKPIMNALANLNAI